VGGSPTTAYAQNIAVMAATRVYSTAACYVSAAVASVFGLSPKFGAVVAATPGGVLGAITVILYAMIAILGAKIWKENDVDFANPINLVPVLLHRHRHRAHEPGFQQDLQPQRHRQRPRSWPLAGITWRMRWLPGT